MLTLKWYPPGPVSKSRLKPMQDLPSLGQHCSSPEPCASKNTAWQALYVLPIITLPLLSFIPLLHAQRPTQVENQLTVAEQYLFEAANQERIHQGLPPLRFDPVLARASSLHARAMAEHETISHQFPDEPELAERGSNAGVRFSLIAENVGEAPSSIIIHSLWMHSPDHRANLLDPNVNTIGISIVTRDHELYAVEDFASTVEPLTLAEQEQAVVGVLAHSGMQLAEMTSEARVTCTMSAGYAGRRPWYIMRYTAASLTELPSQLVARLTTGKYHQAAVGACPVTGNGPFSSYNIAVLLYP